MKVQIIVEHRGNETTYTLKDERRHPYIVLVTPLKTGGDARAGWFAATGGFLNQNDEFITSRVLHLKEFKTAKGAERAAVKYLTSHMPSGDIDVELVHSGTPSKKLSLADYT